MLRSLITDARRAPRAGALLACALLASVVAGQEASAQQPCDVTAALNASNGVPVIPSGVETESDDAGAQLVTNFERTAIRFHAYPELSGEYRLNADNTVSIPVIGRIKVDGLSAACLEKVLARRASEIARRDVFVTVEAVAYRPIFVAGAVAKPGSVQWTPGMTVLQAVALAGGRYRSTEAQNALDPVRANKSFDDQKRALATLSRLRSERAEKAQIEPEPELVQLVGQQEARMLVAAQQSLFESRRTARENALATLERAMDVAREELSALRQRKVVVDEQLRLRRASATRLADLRTKGIVIADRVLEEDFKLAQLDEKALENAVALSRVGASLAGLEHDMVMLKGGRTAEIDAEIAAQERLAAQSRIEVRAAQAAGDLAPARTSQARSGPEVITIVRRTAAGPQHINGGEETPLIVGDTVVLSLQLQ